MGYERRFESHKNGIDVEVILSVGRLRYQATLIVNGQETDHREGFLRLRSMLGMRRNRILLRGEGVRADLRFNKRIANCYWLRRRSEWENFVYGLNVYQNPRGPANEQAASDDNDVEAAAS